jgi:hypothetical protein
MSAVGRMMKNKAAVLRKLLRKPGLKPNRPLPWLQLTIFIALNFVVSNEVECLYKQVWLVELLLAHKSGHEDCLHPSIVDDQTVQELKVFRVVLQLIRS